MKPSRSRWRTTLIMALVAWTFVPSVAPADYVFQTIDVPGVTNPALINVRAINNTGDAAGFYSDSSGGRHGFVVNTSGNVTSFSAPNASTVAGQGTTVTGLSNSGLVAGYFFDATNNNQQTGYTRDALGVVTTFSITGATLTEVNAVNTSATTAGEYILNAVTHGFLRDSSGNVTTIDPTGSTSTVVRGLSDDGYAVGDFKHSNIGGNTNSGFIRDAAGNITIFNPTGSTDTIVESVNDKGVAAGFFFTGNVEHGFIREASGTISTFFIPGSTGTSFNAINDSGVAVGSFTNSGPHGLVVDADGTIHTTVLPTNALAGIVSSINDSGQISGFYNDDVTGAVHGFIGTPRAVPEPMSLSLFVLGAAGLIGGSRRSRTRKDEV